MTAQFEPFLSSIVFHPHNRHFSGQTNTLQKMSSPQKEIENSNVVDIPSSLEVICSRHSEVDAEEDSGSVYIISSESAEPECIYISSESKEEHRIQPQAEAKSFEILDMGGMKPLLLSTPKPTASK